MVAERWKWKKTSHSRGLILCRGVYLEVYLEISRQCSIPASVIVPVFCLILGRCLKSRVGPFNGIPNTHHHILCLPISLQCGAIHSSRLPFVKTSTSVGLGCESRHSAIIGRIFSQCHVISEVNTFNPTSAEWRTSRNRHGRMWRCVLGYVSARA